MEPSIYFKEQVLHAGEQLKKALPADVEQNRQLVKKGLHLYRQGSVYNVKILHNDVSANVQDVTSVKVTLDFDFFEMSSCACPSDKICRHILAAFFHIYAKVDTVGTFIEAWKEPKKHILSSVIRASDLLKQNEQKMDTVDDWLQFFENEYKKWSTTAPNSLQVVQSMYQFLFSRLKRKAPSVQEYKRLYLIHAAIFTLKKLLELINETKPNDYLLQQVYWTYIEEYDSLVSEQLQELRAFALPFGLDPLLKESMEPVRELLYTSKYFSDISNGIYRTLWAQLFNRNDWIDEERKQVQERLNHESEFVGACEYALMHFDFLQKQDEKLLQQLDSLGASGFSLACEWASEIVGKKEWKRMKPWLGYFEENIEEIMSSDMDFHDKRDTVRLILDLLGDYGQNTNDDQTYEHFCQKTLPYSYAEFEYFLLVRERFHTWAELQSLLGFKVFEMDSDTLKEVEKAEPGVLLPLYHDAVSSEIAMRNRQSYKQAVRYLKKLKKIYKKLKKESVWENYLQKLKRDHKRLRAFQEELKRGKLINA